MDANGFLNVSATDKTTGKSNRITIADNRACLSKEEIERMVSEAGRYKAKYAAATERISAKNGLEPYAHKFRNSLPDEKLTGRFDHANKAQERSEQSDLVARLVTGGVEGGVRGALRGRARGGCQPDHDEAVCGCRWLAQWFTGAAPSGGEDGHSIQEVNSAFVM